jgi:Protein of unknown function (DUF2695)
MPENIAYAEPAVPSGDPARDEPARDEPARDEPADKECLRCYLVRMIQARGCDNTRKWTTRWRHRRAARDGQLMSQLEERGGICCDCEVVFNVWQHEDDGWVEGGSPWQPQQPDDGWQDASAQDASAQDASAQDASAQDGPGPGSSACPGTDSEDPLVLCARWRGWSLSDPYDPADDDDDDDDDDYDDVYGDDEPT